MLRDAGYALDRLPCWRMLGRNGSTVNPMNVLLRAVIPWPDDCSLVLDFKNNVLQVPSTLH